MSFITGVFSVVCDNCGVRTDFNSDEADFDAAGGSERPMGPENGYRWQMSFNCDCESKIEFDYQVHEYPQGAFNHENVDISGAKVANTFSYDFSDEPEPDDFE